MIKLFRLKIPSDLLRRISILDKSIEYIAESMNLKTFKAIRESDRFLLTYIRKHVQTDSPNLFKQKPLWETDMPGIGYLNLRSFIPYEIAKGCDIFLLFLLRLHFIKIDNPMRYVTNWTANHNGHMVEFLLILIY